MSTSAARPTLNRCASRPRNDVRVPIYLLLTGRVTRMHKARMNEGALVIPNAALRSAHYLHTHSRFYTAFWNRCVNGASVGPICTSSLRASAGSCGVRMLQQRTRYRRQWHLRWRSRRYRMRRALAHHFASTQDQSITHRPSHKAFVLSSTTCHTSAYGAARPTSCTQAER
ncbi:hypothetical protein C8Q80DRAFT_107548 [Daedaleopsis nitida]|nr:hypothetical protein C8Q80DRAFT_107548 [Daedaleopsis nitida]